MQINKYIKGLLLIGATVALLINNTACNTVRGTGGKVIASTALSVDAAMKGWAQYVVSGKATPVQEQNVREYYRRYQIAILVAHDAYAQSVTSNDTTAFKQAIDVLNTQKAQIISLIQRFMASPTSKVLPENPQIPARPPEIPVDMPPPLPTNP
jgi:predicted small secreted protein